MWIKIFFNGFLLQASLIMALGAQNLFVLDSGLKGRRPLLVAMLCSFCDAVLILLGVSGAASLFVEIPFLKLIFGGAGVFFLLYYSVQKLREALRPSRHEGEKKSDSKLSYLHSRKAIILTSLAFSWLNPHALLDTLVLVGGYSAKFARLSERLIFGLGAGTFSTVWFFSLALSSKGLSKFLQSAGQMRWVSAFSGLILLWISYKLSVEVYSWSKALF